MISSFDRIACSELLESFRPVEHDGAWASPEQMTRQHIFVINGSPEFLDIIRELLQEERYNVTTTNFVPRTYEQIVAAEPHLLLIDLVYGEQAGWDLLATLRTATAEIRDIPVLVVSTDYRLIEKAKQNHAVWGGDRFLIKPFDVDDLLKQVNELIGPA